MFYVKLKSTMFECYYARKVYKCFSNKFHIKQLSFCDKIKAIAFTSRALVYYSIRIIFTLAKLYSFWQLLWILNSNRISEMRTHSIFLRWIKIRFLIPGNVNNKMLAFFLCYIKCDIFLWLDMLFHAHKFLMSQCGMPLFLWSRHQTYFIQ